MSVNSAASSSTANGGGASSTRKANGAKRAVSTETKLSMEEVAKKLSLWHTSTFRPILTHDDLEPILASAGFSPLPVETSPGPSQATATKGGASAAWREYEYCKRGGKGGVGYGGRDEMVIGGGWRPRPRLPCGRLDGLHLMAYKAFFISLEFYLGPHLVPNLFHVRAMPLSRTHDMLEKTYRPMRDCGIEEEGIFVYREGSLDRITKVICSFSNNYYSIASDSSYSNLSSGETESCVNKTNSWREISKNGASECISLVPLKDLFPSNRDLISFS
ncbi:hypothetical protein LUZ60_003388 [Juncus effusus]|nr:hypothetical protein LUZ60_003388 [Juncus effusus]